MARTIAGLVRKSDGVCVNHIVIADPNDYIVEDPELELVVDPEAHTGRKWKNGKFEKTQQELDKEAEKAYWANLSPVEDLRLRVVERLENERTTKLLLEMLLEQENRIRALEGNPPVEKAAFKDDLAAKMAGKV